MSAASARADQVPAAAAAIVRQLKPWNEHWTVAVELSVHVQARAFGFQSVNASQEEVQKGCSTPACSAVAADHLLQLLKDRAAIVQKTRSGEQREDPAVFHECISWLYNAYFEQGPYREWYRKSNMQQMEKKTAQMTQSHSLNWKNSGGQRPASFVAVDAGQEWVRRLADLSLYFLLWTEAANLRHTPELLWLLYNLLLNSNNANKARAVLNSGSYYSAVYWLGRAEARRSNNQQHQQPGDSAEAADTSPDLDSPFTAATGPPSAASTAAPAAEERLWAAVLQRGFVRGVLLPVRDTYGNAFMLGGILQGWPGPYNRQWQAGESSSINTGHTLWAGLDKQSLAKRQCEGLSYLMLQGKPGPGGWSLLETVENDITLFGDGCIVLDMVIQPIFNLLAEQVGLMGLMKEQPALRLGYDDVNESASIATVIGQLLHKLEASKGKDVWDNLLLHFKLQAVTTREVMLQQQASPENPLRQESYYPATIDMLDRYPRDYRRLGPMAAMLRTALEPAMVGNPGVGAASHGASRGWSVGSIGGSAPLVHLLPSLRATDSLWAALFKKTFIETRSIGAVAVAFSRLYTLHAVMLCWMSLWAYLVPDMTLSALFTASFWATSGLKVAECASYGLLVHALLHVVKDVCINHLLSTPKAIRVQGKPAELKPVQAGGSAEKSRYRRWKDNLSLWWEKKWLVDNKKDAELVLVQPPVFSGRLLKGHNLLTLLFWLVCFIVLLDSHFPSWPLNKLLANSRMLGGAGTGQPSVMPVWAFISLLYVGLWVLHRMWQLLTDFLPTSLSQWMGQFSRKDGRGAAEHFFPYGSLSNSQDWRRFVANSLLWALVLIVKFLFDFFVVLQPIAKGPVGALLSPLSSDTPWHVWAESILLSWSLWVAAAFLVFYDTGLFWQLLGALYSTMVLGMHRRVGHVKTLYDLVWAFPRLGHKFRHRMLASAGQPDSSPVQQPQEQKLLFEAAQNVVGSMKDPNTTAEADSNCLPLEGLPLCPAEEVLLHCAWDKVVDDLRSRDLLSNAEAAMLKYEMLSLARLGCSGAWMLLPRFVAAGAAVEVNNNGITSASQMEVVCRSLNLLAWVLRQAELITDADLAKVVMLPSQEAVEKSVEAGQCRQQASPAAADKAAGNSGTAGSPRDLPDKEDQKINIRVAKHKDVIAAAQLLTSSKDLLNKLLGKLQATKDGQPEKIDQSDIDTQLLMEAALNGLVNACEGVELPYQNDEHINNALDNTIKPDAQPFLHRQLATKAVKWLLDMLTLTRGEAAPALPEASRVLCFFATSLNNPKMPAAATVACSRSMTTLTPHYNEDVVYPFSIDAAVAEMKVQGLEPGDRSGCLVNQSGDPTETLKYLSVVYKAEWANFVERLLTQQDVQHYITTVKKQKMPSAADITYDSFAPGGVLHHWLHGLLSWASMRGQLILRTVHGMMYYETALQQLVLMQCRQQLVEMARRCVPDDVGLRHTMAANPTWVEEVVNEAALMLARQKFTYVLSSQALGEIQLAREVPKRWLAHCIRTVVAQRYPSLRIAYIDLENLGKPPKGALKPPAAAAAAVAEEAEQCDSSAGAQGGLQRRTDAVDVSERNRTKGGSPVLMRQYSVLLQWSAETQCVQELYRVRLPMNLETDTGVILGEGKPENQNHAVIFCHNETLQTIDSNQDGYLAEAFKLPNLLAEFGELAGGSSSGGKGSKWRCCLPGTKGFTQGPALVGFKEWIFSEDSGALAEFAAATERSFGTTVQRVMHNPGACRFHYGHPDVWDKLFTMTNGGVSKATKALHVSEDVFGGYNVMLRGRDITYVDYIAVGKGRDMGFETINTFEAKIAGGNGEQVVARDVHRLARRLNTPRLLTWYHTGNGFFINSSLLMYSLLINAWLCLLLALSSSTAVGSSVLQDALALLGGLQLLQLGSLSLLVYVATVWLEDGFLVTLKNVLKQLVAGSLLFYVFRGRTTACAFTNDVKYGGAKYEATGRGYKLKATPFIDLFQHYARSHMWYGAHILLLVVVALCVGLPFSILGLWSYVLVVAALLMAPFWFNPFTFSWDGNKAAAREFMAWMAGHKPAGKSKKLWRTFNHDQLLQLADDEGIQLGRTPGNLFNLLYMAPILIIIGYAVAGMLDVWWKSVIVVASANGLLYLLVGCWAGATRLESVRNGAVLSRLVKFCIKFLVLVGLVVLLVFMTLQKQRWLFKVVVTVAYIEFELARLLCQLLLAFLPHYQPARRLVNSMCWLADLVVGLLLLLLLFIGSLFGLLTRYQAAVLFSFGYAAAYLAEKDLEGSELGRLAKELKELRRKERLLASSASNGVVEGEGTATGAGPAAVAGGAARQRRQPHGASSSSTSTASVTTGQVQRADSTASTFAAAEEAAAAAVAAAQAAAAQAAAEAAALAKAEAAAAQAAAGSAAVSTAGESRRERAASGTGSQRGSVERGCSVTRGAAIVQSWRGPAAGNPGTGRVSCPADVSGAAALPDSQDGAAAAEDADALHGSSNSGSGSGSDSAVLPAAGAAAPAGIGTLEMVQRSRRSSAPGNSMSSSGSNSSWLKKGQSRRYQELQHNMDNGQGDWISSDSEGEDQATEAAGEIIAGATAADSNIHDAGQPTQ